MHSVRRFWSGRRAKAPPPEPSLHPPPSEAELAVVWRDALRAAFLAGEADGVLPLVRPSFGPEAAIVFDGERQWHPLTFTLDTLGGSWRFEFSTPMAGDVAALVFHRWWELQPLLKRLFAQHPHAPIEAIFNLGDAATENGFAFCDNRATITLIPDCIFVGTLGYAAIRQAFSQNAVAWADKHDPVFWRGSSTGWQEGSVLDLPRVALCRLGRAAPAGLFDVGLTAIVDRTEDDARILAGENLTAPLVSHRTFDRYKFHIDIDGHTNAWSALMQKLLSGGLVFKIDPPFGHRQWYYDRLRPWENYVPVRSDLGDLLDLVGYFKANEPLARQIAEEGRRLAYAMAYEGELDAGVRAIIARCARDRYEAAPASSRMP